MQFNSIDFLIFFPVVLAIYFIIPREARAFWLLVSSYYFYMSWNAEYAILIAVSTLLTFGCGLALGHISKKWCKILVLVICIVLNMGILGVFKYGNFTIDSLNSLFSNWGITLIERKFDLLLPVGISFYTFQAVGYIIDVYRGEIDAEKNIIKYALFVSFFPQLVAGPIERSKNLLGQIRNIDKIKLWNAKRVSEGVTLLVWGFFMKMVIADRVAVFVNTVFEDYQVYSGVELVLAALGFTLQIYCDFGSYSMIAIGAAKIMGFDLMENFNAPYFAASIREFWGRWHISLSTWFRDYLYIPLGGNRKGMVRKLINLMIVFLVSGLWHGASWTFVIWGAIHGLYQILGIVLKPAREFIKKHLHFKTENFSWKFLQILTTFVLVAFAWIFFRADTINDAWGFITRIPEKFQIWTLFDGSIFNLGLDAKEANILLVAVVILIIVDAIRYRKGLVLDAFLQKQNLFFRWAVLIALIVMILVFGEYGPSFDAQQFIYFQF